MTDSSDSGYEEEDRAEARARGTGVGRRQAPDGSGQDRMSEPESEQGTSVPVNVGSVSAGVTAGGPKAPRGDGGRGRFRRIGRRTWEDAQRSPWGWERATSKAITNLLRHDLYGKVSAQGLIDTAGWLTIEGLV